MTQQKIVFSMDEVSQISNIGRTKLYQAINEGTLKARKFGRKTLILKSDLEEFLLNLESYTPLNNEVQS